MKLMACKICRIGVSLGEEHFIQVVIPFFLAVFPKDSIVEIGPLCESCAQEWVATSKESEA